ncbi:hypothetical protein AZZ93_002771, partial [Escherichia coli]
WWSLRMVQRRTVRRRTRCGRG